MKLLCRVFLATFLTPLLMTTVHAADHRLTNEDIRQSREVREGQLSSDGAHVLAVITDTTADGGRPHLWLLGRNPDTPRQLTFSSGEKDKGQYKAAWLPDGSTVLFLQDGGSGARLFRMPMQGGEPQPLALKRQKDGKLVATWGAEDASSDFDIRDYAVSPDGKLIALTTARQDSAEEQANKAKRNDAISFGDDIHEATLQIVSLDSNLVLEVALSGVASVAWDRASQRILAVTQAKFADLGPAANVWIVDARSAATTHHIEGLPKTITKAEWISKNRIVYFGHCQQDTPTDCQDLYTYDLDDHLFKNLTDRLEGTIAPDSPIIVDSDGRSAVLLFNRGVNQEAVKIDLDNGKSEFLDVGVPVVSFIGTNESRNGWVLIAEGPTEPNASLFLASSSASAKPTRLMTPDLVPGKPDLVASKKITWRGDGQQISGLLYLPPTPGPAPVPLVVHVHGGPGWQFTDRYYPLVNLLVAQGWAVLQPNPRGSTGSSKAFLAANKDDLGGGDLRDVLTGVDYVKAHFPIDSQRLALIGYSYGGEMAGFAAGKTHIFRALISGGPVTDQISEYGTEEGQWAWYDHWYFGNPTVRFSAAWRQSPISYAPKATTPVLIVESVADTLDPPGQAFELYRALHQAGDQVELVTFPRESHAELHRNFYGEVSVEPWHGFDLRRRMLEFISRAFESKQPSN
jgi:dipeptidyl aminopeptidase/acylaminoacyl peptidase